VIAATVDTTMTPHGAQRLPRDPQDHHRDQQADDRVADSEAGARGDRRAITARLT